MKLLIQEGNSILGKQQEIAQCHEVGSGIIVDQSMCNHLSPPKLVTKECDMGTCPPTYSLAAKYGQCSVTCGKGNCFGNVLMSC